MHVSSVFVHFSNIFESVPASHFNYLALILLLLLYRATAHSLRRYAVGAWALGTALEHGEPGTHTPT